MRRAKIASAATPPMTPPAIAPVFVELFVDDAEEVETGIDVVMDISVVTIVVDPNAFVEVIVMGTVVATDVMEVVVGVVLVVVGVVEVCSLLLVVVEDIDVVGLGVTAEVVGDVDVGVDGVDGVLLVVGIVVGVELELGVVEVLVGDVVVGVGVDAAVTGDAPDDMMARRKNKSGIGMEPLIGAY